MMDLRTTSRSREYITVTAAAAAVGKSYSWIYRHLGQIPHYVRPGTMKPIYFDEAELIEAVKRLDTPQPV